VRKIDNTFFGDKKNFDYYFTDMKNWNNQHIIWMEDPIDFWFYEYTPKEGEVVLDIGAGFGNDAVAFSRAVGDSGKVIAIEAHPVAAERLKKTIKWSKLNNCLPVDAAVGDENGTVKISGEFGGVDGSILDDAAAGHDVKMRKCDDIVADLQLPRVDYIKMNIEGAEKMALLGMPNALKSAKNVAIACHDFRFEAGESEIFKTKADVAAILHEYGFNISFRTQDVRPYVRDILYGRKRD
jgi:FkbM family methyltransferase